MITEIILIVFAIIYYLFSIFLFATVICKDKIYTDLQIFGMALMSMILAPIATPIILGIEVGEAIKDN